MTNKDQNTYISTYMKHENIFQNRLQSYSEKIHFFSDQTLDIYKFLNTMTFLSVNHNSLYTILGTYPPGPFRNNQNSPKKIPFFQHFQQHFSSAEISSMQNFSSAGNLLERPTVLVMYKKRYSVLLHYSKTQCSINF